MNTQKTSLNLGDSVKVKPHVLDPDTEAFSLEGWQGRIIDIRPQEDGTTIVDIEWDSLTLREMPQQSIEACEEEVGAISVEWDRISDVPNESRSIYVLNVSSG